MASPCIGFEIGLGHICWYFRAYICSKILKVLHPCIGFGIGLGHIWGHANAWIWYIHAYAWILYIHVLSHISHIPKAEIFGFMFQYLSSERMGLRFWANPIHNTWLDHGEISRTRCTPFCPVMQIASLPDFRDKCEYLVNVTQCLPGLVYGGARSHLAAEHTAPKTQSPHCTSSRKKAERGTKWP